MKNGKSYERINGQKPHIMKKRYSNTMQHGELRSYLGSRLVNEFFLKLAFFIQGRKLIILRLPQARFPHQP